MRPHRPASQVGLALAILVAIAGCSATPAGSAATASAEPTPTGAPSAVAPSASAAPSTALGPPVGVIAMGHSGLTGEGTGGQYEAVFENSWATGSSPEVNSVYLRLTKVRPETVGHVANTAHGGADAAELLEMTRMALQTVPRPALAIISTIDNDIRCDGTDGEHVPELGASVRGALEAITAASPNTKILVVGQFGRPSIPFVQKLVAHDPAVKASLSGVGRCDFFDMDGKVVPKNFETLTGIIDAYEAEQARVCGAFPNCRTDGGARAAYVDVLENFSPDWAHLNVKGQAAEASLIWPVVEDLLGL